MSKYIWLFVVGSMLCGCELWSHKRPTDAAVELNGHYLYQSDLDDMTRGLSSEDSARVVEQYINQWAMDWLVYDVARDHAEAAIEALVEDYRRSLYVHAYEEHLIGSRMPKAVSDDVVKAFYEEHQQQFVLRESIVHGVLLAVPNDAPKMAQLKTSLSKVGTDSEENADILEKLEKYAYQYASAYELFLDEWKTANELLVSMPFQTNDLLQQLRQKQQIEVRDSATTFILQVVDKHLEGELSPMDYARAEIEAIVLRERQVEFLNQERKKLLDKAIKNEKLKILKDEK